jgi:hypothetical protein
MRGSTKLACPNCGKNFTRFNSQLREQNFCSAACRNVIVNPAKKHGLSTSVEYVTFRGAMNRCSNPKIKNYAEYGGRGIKFLFTSFEQFLAEVGPKPSPRHSIDRINNDGNYEPGNIRWATRQEQIANRRPVRTWRGRPVVRERATCL